jgi:hypothetical protein
MHTPFEVEVRAQCPKAETVYDPGLFSSADFEGPWGIPGGENV